MVDRAGLRLAGAVHRLTVTGASARVQTGQAAGDGNRAASNPDKEDVMTDVLTGRSLRSPDQRARRASLPPYGSQPASEGLRTRAARLGPLRRRLIVLLLVAGAIVLTPVLVGSVADLIERARTVVPWLLAQLQDLVYWAGGWLIPILAGLLVIEHILRDREEER
jgi:hypothetical protein